MPTATLTRLDAQNTGRLVHTARVSLDIRRIGLLEINLAASRAEVVLRALLDEEDAPEDMHRLTELANMLQRGIPSTFNSRGGDPVLVAVIQKAWMEQSRWLSDEEMKDTLANRTARYRRAATSLQTIARGGRSRSFSLNELLHMVTNLRRAASSS